MPTDSQDKTNYRMRFVVLDPYRMEKGTVTTKGERQ